PASTHTSRSLSVIRPHILTRTIPITPSGCRLHTAACAGSLMPDKRFRQFPVHPGRVRRLQDGCAHEHCPGSCRSRPPDIFGTPDRTLADDENPLRQVLYEPFRGGYRTGVSFQFQYVPVVYPDEAQVQVPCLFDILAAVDLDERLQPERESIFREMCQQVPVEHRRYQQDSRRPHRDAFSKLFPPPYEVLPEHRHRYRYRDLLQQRRRTAI